DAIQRSTRSRRSRQPSTTWITSSRIPPATFSRMRGATSPSRGDGGMASARDDMLVTDMVEDQSTACATPVAVQRPAGARTRPDECARGPGGAHAHDQLDRVDGDAASGRVNENSAPSPFLLATAIRPPWASTMPLAIARPRPAPPFLVRPLQ